MQAYVFEEAQMINNFGTKKQKTVETSHRAPERAVYKHFWALNQGKTGKKHDGVCSYWCDRCHSDQRRISLPNWTFSTLTWFFFWLDSFMPSLPGSRPHPATWPQLKGRSVVCLCHNNTICTDPSVLETTCACVCVCEWSWNKETETDRDPDYVWMYTRRLVDVTDWTQSLSVCVCVCEAVADSTVGYTWECKLPQG